MRGNDEGQCPECETCAIRDGWLFSRLGSREMELLISFSRATAFTRRQILFREGEPASHMYLITRGVVKLTRVSPGGRVQVFGLIYPGQIAGIEGLFQSESALGAESLTAGSACVIPRDQMLRLLRDHPEFAVQLLEAMHHELEQARARIQEMGKTSAEAKICALMCDLLPHLRGATPSHEGFPLAHSDLAEILGLSRETISRAVGGLAKRGVVTVSHHHVEVHDQQRLRELAR